jgi:hypothetical protein
MIILHKEIEKLIMVRVKEIRNMYRTYYPKGEYLNMTILNDSIMINNQYLGEDKDFPINYNEIKDENYG